MPSEKQIDTVARMLDPDAFALEKTMLLMRGRVFGHHGERVRAARGKAEELLTAAELSSDTQEKQAEPCKNPDCGCMFPRDCPSEPNWDGEPVSAAEPAVLKMPEIPDDDSDFTPELARKIIAKYQEHIRSLTASASRLHNTSGVSGVMREIDPRHFDILVEAMAEVKATSDGLSDQPIADIVQGCIDEIEALEPTEPATDAEPYLWLHPWNGSTSKYRSDIAADCPKDGPQPIPLFTHPNPSEARLREALEMIARIDLSHLSECREIARAALKEASDERA